MSQLKKNAISKITKKSGIGFTSIQIYVLITGNKRQWDFHSLCLRSVYGTHHVAMKPLTILFTPQEKEMGKSAEQVDVVLKVV